MCCMLMLVSVARGLSHRLMNCACGVSFFKLINSIGAGGIVCSNLGVLLFVDLVSLKQKQA